MIKINHSDTIVDIINKIKWEKESEIILEIPFWHHILHNYLSLKIIKNKVWNKRLTIVTSDISSSKIWKQLWINYSIIKDSEFITSNSKKQELLKHNFTFFEYLVFEIKKYYNRFISFIFRSDNKFKYVSPKEKIRKIWIFFLTLSIISSFLMLIFVFNFAVNRTFVDITPEVEVKTQSINIVYSDSKLENNIFSNDIIINTKKIDVEVDLSQTFKSTWIDYEKTKRAKWKVKMINELKYEQIYKPWTRLLNEDWLVFLIDDWIRIPPATIDDNWELVFWESIANITARLEDDNWNFIWERWNISWDHTFILPGLKFNQDKVYAKLLWETTWWSNDVEYFISENDFKNAKEFFEKRIKDVAIDALKKKINDENIQNSIDYEIINVNNIISFSDLDIRLENNEIWDKVENFTVSWSIKASTYVYNKEALKNIFRDLINNNLIHWIQRLTYIDFDSIRFSEVLSRQNEPFSIKATTEVDIWISFDFNNNQNNYNQMLKSKISWLNKNEAISILLNDTKIKNVSITNKPFFISKVSWNINNIIMRIKD